MRDLIAIATCFFASSLCAQRSYIVDQQNGPGTDFVELQKAIDAASPGDRIVVRDGVYKPPTIDKGVSIATEFYGALFDQTRGVLTIRNVPARQHCALSGFAFFKGFIQIENCKGSVALSGLASAEGVSTLWPTVNIVDSVAVSIHQCGIKSSIHCLRSRLQVTDSVIVPTLTPVGLLGSGIRVIDGELEITNSIVKGGNTASNFPADAAITTIGSSKVAVRGACTLEGGLNGTMRVESMRGNNPSSLVLDSRTTLVGATTGFGTTQREGALALSASYTVLGASSRLRLQGDPEELVVLFAGLARSPDVYPGLGAWWLDLSASILLESRTLSTQGLGETRFSLPRSALLRGLPIGFQCFSRLKSGKFRISNSVLDAIH